MQSRNPGNVIKNARVYAMEHQREFKEREMRWCSKKGFTPNPRTSALEAG